MANSELNPYKDIPGYREILKSVLKMQIQQLVEQLAAHTDEESVILTASISEGTISHLGSNSGKLFLDDNDIVKSQFLRFCLVQKQQEDRHTEAGDNDFYGTNSSHRFRKTHEKVTDKVKHEPYTTPRPSNRRASSVPRLNSPLSFQRDQESERRFASGEFSEDQSPSIKHPPPQTPGANNPLETTSIHLHKTANNGSIKPVVPITDSQRNTELPSAGINVSGSSEKLVLARDTSTVSVNPRNTVPSGTDESEKHTAARETTSVSVVPTSEGSVKSGTHNRDNSNKSNAHNTSEGDACNTNEAAAGGDTSRLCRSMSELGAIEATDDEAKENTDGSNDRKLKGPGETKDIKDGSNDTKLKESSTGLYNSHSRTPGACEKDGNVSGDEETSQEMPELDRESDFVDDDNHMDYDEMGTDDDIEDFKCEYNSGNQSKSGTETHSNNGDNELGSQDITEKNGRKKSELETNVRNELGGVVKDETRVNKARDNIGEEGNGEVDRELGSVNRTEEHGGKESLKDSSKRDEPDGVSCIKGVETETAGQVAMETGDEEDVDIDNECDALGADILKACVETVHNMVGDVEGNLDGAEGREISASNKCAKTYGAVGSEVDNLKPYIKIEAEDSFESCTDNRRMKKDEAGANLRRTNDEHADDDSESEAYKVLAIWNDIASNPNDASRQVLYDLIKDKIAEAEAKEAGCSLENNSRESTISSEQVKGDNSVDTGGANLAKESENATTESKQSSQAVGSVKDSSKVSENATQSQASSSLGCSSDVNKEVQGSTGGEDKLSQINSQTVSESILKALGMKTAQTGESIAAPSIRNAKIGVTIAGRSMLSNNRKAIEEVQSEMSEEANSSNRDRRSSGTQTEPGSTSMTEGVELSESRNVSSKDVNRGGGVTGNNDGCNMSGETDSGISDNTDIDGVQCRDAATETMEVSNVRGSSLSRRSSTASSVGSVSSALSDNTSQSSQSRAQTPGNSSKTSSHSSTATSMTKGAGSATIVIDVDVVDSQKTPVKQGNTLSNSVTTPSHRSHNTPTQNKPRNSTPDSSNKSRRRIQENTPSKAGSKPGKGTPGKGNFIDNLISKGVPIIIPDDPEEEDDEDMYMPMARTSAFQMKSKQHQDAVAMASPVHPRYNLQGMESSPQHRLVHGHVGSPPPSQQHASMLQKQLFTPPKNVPSSASAAQPQQQSGSWYPTMPPHARQQQHGSPQQVAQAIQHQQQRYVAGSPSAHQPGSQTATGAMPGPRNPMSASKPQYIQPPRPQQVFHVRNTAHSESPSSTGQGLSASYLQQQLAARNPGHSQSPVRKALIQQLQPRNIPSGTTIVIDDEQATSANKNNTASNSRRSQHLATPSQSLATPSQSVTTPISTPSHPHPGSYRDRLPTTITSSTPATQRPNKPPVPSTGASQTLQSAPAQTPNVVQTRAVVSSSDQLPIISSVTSIDRVSYESTADVVIQQRVPAPSAINKRLSVAQLLSGLATQVSGLGQIEPEALEHIVSGASIKRSSSDDSPLSSNENQPPPRKRRNISEERPTPSLIITQASNPPLPSTLNIKTESVEAVSPTKQIPKLEIDIDVPGMLPVITDDFSGLQRIQNEPQSTRIESPRSSSPKTSVDKLKQMERAETFSPPMSPSTRRLHSQSSTSASGELLTAKEEQEEPETTTLPDKSFGCGDCGKTFATKHGLTIHFKTHTKRKPFECDVCGRHYSKKLCLTKHVLTHFEDSD